MKVTKKEVVDEMIKIPEYRNIDYLIKEGNKQAKRDKWNKLIRLDDHTYFCTNCNSTHQDKKIKINEYKKCPVCNSKLQIYKRNRNVMDYCCWLTITTLNKRNELILRTFSFKKMYNKKLLRISYEVLEAFRWNLDRNISVKRYINNNNYLISCKYNEKDRWKELTDAYKWKAEVPKAGYFIGSNVKKCIEKSKYKYANILEISKRWYLEDYIFIYDIFPEIEMIYKMGMTKYFRNIMRYMGVNDVEDVRKFLKENKRFFRVWSKINPDKYEMQMMVDLNTFDIEYARDALKVGYRKSKNHYANDKKTIQYLKKQKRDFSFWMDYIDFLERLHVSIDKSKLFPKDLKKEHDKMFNNLEILDNKEYEQEIIDFENMIRPYNYENYDYIIRAARTVEELVNESSQMNHCVRNYIPKIAAHQSAVFFVRKQEEKEKSLVTVEIDPVNKILLQARGYDNKEPTITEMAFINDWCHKRIIDNSMLTNTL